MHAISLEQAGTRSGTKITGDNINIDPTEDALRDRAVQNSFDMGLSITDILESNEISPPEKKRRIKDKGEIIANSLKNVADAHRENILTVLGNVASEDVHSDVCDIIVGATDVVFKRLGAKKAFDMVLSDESQSAMIHTHLQLYCLTGNCLSFPALFSIACQFSCNRLYILRLPKYRIAQNLIRKLIDNRILTYHQHNLTLCLSKAARIADILPC